MILGLNPRFIYGQVCLENDLSYLCVLGEKKMESRKIDMGHTTSYTGMEHTRKYNRIGFKEDAN